MIPQPDPDTKIAWRLALNGHSMRELCAVLEADGQLIFEGECLRNYAETVDGKAVCGESVKQLAASDVPLALCAPGQFKERPNWFIPNLACLRSWAAAGGLDIVRHAFIEDPARRPFPIQRVWGVAVKSPVTVAVNKVTQEGSTVFVIGSGFTQETAINLFCRSGEGDINLGGLDIEGKPLIAIIVHSPTMLSFAVPDAAVPGKAYLQALNPPFTQNFNSGTGPGGSFVLEPL